MAGSVLLPYMSKKGPFSIEVPGTGQSPGESKVRRNVKAQHGLISTPDPSIRTVYDIVQHSARKYGSAEAVGSRAVIRTHREKKMVKKVVGGKSTEVEKEWTYFELGPFTYLTYVEFQEHINHLGSGLRKLGLSKGDRLHIYGATR